jgi:hypothetical protein
MARPVPGRVVGATCDADRATIDAGEVVEKCAERKVLRSYFVHSSESVLAWSQAGAEPGTCT